MTYKAFCISCGVAILMQTDKFDFDKTIDRFCHACVKKLKEVTYVKAKDTFCGVPILIPTDKIDKQIEEKVTLPTLLEEFDSAIKNITTERGKIYGHPKEDFERAQTMIGVVETCSHPGVRHVLTMLCVKIARLVNSPDHLDSWIDITGYARTAILILDKEKKNENT